MRKKRAGFKGEAQGLVYLNCSFSKLEALANNLNRRYDASRLTFPKPVDVYDIVDLLGARIAFEYLSPDRTYLGVTLFNSSILYVWPGNPFVKGMMPTNKIFYGGTIIIDRDLSESKLEQDRFAENFTMMHECFHFDQHKDTIKYVDHMSRSFSGYGQQQSDKSSALYYNWY